MNLKDRLLQDKINSMKQLDRIEFLNKVIASKPVFDSTFYIIGVVALFFVFHYAIVIGQLSKYGIEASVYISGMRIFMIISIGFMALHFLFILLMLPKIRERNEQLEDFIEEHAK